MKNINLSDSNIKIPFLSNNKEKFLLSFMFNRNDPNNPNSEKLNFVKHKS
jgi:hypothetical protein